MECRQGFLRSLLLILASCPVIWSLDSLFPFEREQLTDEQASQHELFRFGDLTDPGEISTAPCKVFPGETGWPSPETWDVFNKTLGGALIATVPIGAVCHNDGGHYDSAACEYVMANWDDSYLHAADPSSIMTPWLAGRTCDPTTNSTEPCTLGGFPQYVVNASTVAQMQLAVNFARNANIRLVIKNTGHDFLGKSAGAGALSIWTHNMKDIEMSSQLDSADYAGPATKLGLGVQSFEIYAAAKEAGVTMVGGEGATVGVVGGYVLGGGHSPVSGIYGMGADQVLSMQVITADGRFVTADPEENSELLWALSGGGGGTFGIVTSAVFKVYPAIPVTIVKLSFASGTGDFETFWEGVRAYFDVIVPSVDEGSYSYFSILPSADGQMSFALQPFFAPNKTVEEVNELLEPFYSHLEELGIEVKPNITHYDNYNDAWTEGFVLDPVGFTGQIGSRLFPRKNFETADTLNITFEAIKNNSDAGNIFLGFSVGPTLERGGYANNSVSPWWRDSVLHAWAGATWSADATTDEIKAVRDRFNSVELQRWRDAAPDSGCYLNEAYLDEPDWQSAFYGSVYPQLYELKQAYDPYGLFFGHRAVGSEDWEVKTPDGLPTANGRLCRLDHGGRRT